MGSREAEASEAAQVYTNRVILLGAGFSRSAGMPLASELLDQVRSVARRYLADSGASALDDALERYREYLRDTDPLRAFDIEEFGAWLDWEDMLQLEGSDTFSDAGSRASLQLRWAIGHVLNEAMPDELPEVYLEFARRLTVWDQVLTLNYDLVLERALDAVGLPYRRFPDRYGTVNEHFTTTDAAQPDELILSKLHGSLDWVGLPLAPSSELHVDSLVEGPRPAADPLGRIGVIAPSDLDSYYQSTSSWWRTPPLIMSPSTAKPLAGSALVPLWRGLLQWAGTRGSLIVIGCSLPAGDPYVRRVVHKYATEIAYSMDQRFGLPWPQTQMKVVDYRPGRVSIAELRERYRFMPAAHTDFVLDGFSQETLDRILPARLP